jgi:hypothetical protein
MAGIGRFMWFIRLAHPFVGQVPVVAHGEHLVEGRMQP